MNINIIYDNLDYSRNKNIQQRPKSFSTNNLFYHNNNNNNNQIKKSKLNDSEINETIEKCYKNLQEIRQRFFLGEQNNNNKYFYPSTQTSKKQLKINNNNFYSNIKLESSIDKKNNFNSDIQRIEVSPEIERIKKRRMSYNLFNSYHGNKTQVIKNNYNTSNISRINNAHYREDKKMNSENKILNNFKNHQNKFSSKLYLNRSHYYKTKYNNNDFINFDSYQNKMLHKMLQKKSNQIDELIKENKILKNQIENFLSQKEEYEKNDYFNKLIESKNEIIRLKKIIYEYHRKNNHLQEQVIYLNRELSKLSKYQQTQNIYLNEKKLNTEQKISDIIKNIDENEEKKDKPKEIEKYINKNRDELDIQALVLKNKQLNEMNNLYKDKIKDYDKELNKLNITLKEKTNIIFSLEKAKSQNKNKTFIKNIKIDDNNNINKNIKTNLKINDKNIINKSINKNSKIIDNNININKNISNNLKENDKNNINNNKIINLNDINNKKINKSKKTNLKENDKNISNNLKGNDNKNINKILKNNLNINVINNNINKKDDHVQYQNNENNFNTLDENKKDNIKEIECLKNKLKFIDNIESKYKELISTDKRSKVSSLSDENSKKIKENDDEEKNLSLIRNANELNDKKNDKEDSFDDNYLNYFLEGKES